jgi:hypothetical protein
MSLAKQTVDSLKASHSGVLIVSDAADQEVRGFREALRRAGVPIESVPDVYAATAKLARGDWVGRIVVDVRTLDDKEMAFLRLVPRFFPRCELIVPAFDGTADRASLGSIGFQPVALSVAIEAAAAGYSEITTVAGIGLLEPESVAREVPEVPLQQEAYDQEPAAAPGQMEQAAAIATQPGETEALSPPDNSTLPPPLGDSPMSDAPEDTPAEGSVESPPVLRLSTDGGPEAAGTGPAIHEVVRMRMAAEERRPIRRAPPRTPPGGKPAQSPAAPPEDRGGVPSSPMDPMLSPDEMDALLRDDGTASEETLPSDEGEGDAK